MKVLFLTNIPSPYRVDFFNELGKYCDLTVLCERNSSVERDESWKKIYIKNFSLITLKGINIGVAEGICPTVMKYIDKSYDHIIVTNFSDPTGIIAITYMKVKHIEYEIESDGGFAGTGKGIKENLKRWLLKDANKFYSTGKEHDLYYLMYGAKKENIVRYPFSSVYKKDILDDPITFQEKEILRKKLGIKEETVILAVGQFIFRKGYDILFDALSQIDSSIGCYIVGGKPTNEYLQLVKKKSLKNIHFVDFKIKSELDDYYKAADIFVHPTREDIWGLVINEAMSKGLPIITTNKCLAGLELIDENELGRIIPIENATELSKAILEELDDISYHKNIMVLNKIKNYTIESMVSRHLEIFESKNE